MLTHMGRWTLKAAAIWLALVAGSIVGGIVMGGVTGPIQPDGPFSAQAALLIVTGMHAAMFAGLSSQARIRGAALALFLFTVLFGTQTVLMQIETVFFSDYVGVPRDVLARIVAAAAVPAAFAAATAALVFKPARSEAPVHEGLLWRIPAVAAAYVMCYFAAGYAIAWQSEALRHYYADAAGIAHAPLIALQIVRGALWALLALLIVRNLKGTLAARAGMTALAFSVFGTPQLLYPNPYMPWAVRLPHLIEVGVSNALFGALAAALLLVPRWPWRARRGAPAQIMT